VQVLQDLFYVLLHVLFYTCDRSLRGTTSNAASSGRQLLRHWPWESRRRKTVDHPARRSHPPVDWNGARPWRAPRPPVTEGIRVVRTERTACRELTRSKAPEPPSWFSQAPPPGDASTWRGDFETRFSPTRRNNIYILISVTPQVQIQFLLSSPVKTCLKTKFWASCLWLHATKQKRPFVTQTRISQYKDFTIHTLTISLPSCTDYAVCVCT